MDRRIFVYPYYITMPVVLFLVDLSYYLCGISIYVVTNEEFKDMELDHVRIRDVDGAYLRLRSFP